MKKITILSFCILFFASIISFAQKNIKVAVIEPIVESGEISSIYKSVLRSKLIATISQMQGYEAFTRADVDAILSEQEFQRSGAVNQDQIKKIGDMGGVDLICISKIVEGDGYMNIETMFLNVQSAKVEKTANKLFKKTIPNLDTTAVELAEQLVGLDVLKAEEKEAKRIEEEKVKKYGKQVGNTNLYVAIADEQGTYTWEGAKQVCANRGNGWNLPSIEELNQLYLNKDAIGGFSDDYYWSSTEYDSTFAWYQNFYSGYQTNYFKSFRERVRCVRRAN